MYRILLPNELKNANFLTVQ